MSALAINRPWALVTGASEGIGRALAEGLAADGHPLLLVARRATELQALAQALQMLYAVPVQVLALDLAQPGASARLAEATAGLDFDLVALAAGVGSSGPLLEQALDAERAQLQLNVVAVLEQCHHFGRRLRERGGGALLLFSSVLAFQGAPGSANYAAGKAYVQSLGEALRSEWRAQGVRVLVLAPGPVHSGFAARAGLRFGLALQPADVAQQALAALRRGAGFARPGWLSKLLGWSLATLPRPLRVRVITQVMAGMRP